MSKTALSRAPFLVIVSRNKWLTKSKSGWEIRQFPLLSSSAGRCTGILPSSTFRSPPSAPNYRYTTNLVMMSSGTSHRRSPLNPRNETANHNHNQQQQTQSGFENKESRTTVSNPVHDKVQHLLHSDTTGGGWENCWKEGATPWDLGRPTPILLHLHSTAALPKGRALIPGCGTGHDVVAIACPERYVVGLDISHTAINKAIELSSSSPNADYLTFTADDFFTWQPSELFNLIFDYTFFCALEPDMRSRWARRIHDLLKPDGELITLIFPISDHVGGPPYKVSVADYDGVLNPFGFKATSIMENELAVGARKGREKLARWKRAAARSVL